MSEPVSVDWEKTVDESELHWCVSCRQQKPLKNFHAASRNFPQPPVSICGDCSTPEQRRQDGLNRQIDAALNRR